jgi:heat shock protein HtpX
MSRSVTPLSLQVRSWPTHEQPPIRSRRRCWTPTGSSLDRGRLTCDARVLVTGRIGFGHPTGTDLPTWACPDARLPTNSKPSGNVNSRFSSGTPQVQATRATHRQDRHYRRTVLKEIARNKRRSAVVVVLFFVVWIGIGAGLGVGFANRTNRIGGLVTGVVVAGILAVGAVVFALTSGSRLVLAVAGAHLADPQQYQQLHNIVEELALADGLPKPLVYVIDDPSPNAFATGIGPNRAAITATTGLLATMNREELEGVISHELSHIKNYDVRLILVVSTLLGLAALLLSLMLRALFVSRGRLVGLVLPFVVAFMIIAVIVGPLIRLALSRSRESLADVSGANLTRNPVGLIHALQKLEQNDKPLAKFNHATAAMCIDDPLQHHEGWYHHLFDTHPPIEERIAVLEQIAHGSAA